MKVSDRAPYCGNLVFAAFSGSHQDAIAKGMAWREEKNLSVWSVPYLPIDPKDVGRTYDADVIRINSQSGKGGVSYILAQNFGLKLPKKMQEDMGYTAKHVSDEAHKELSPDWVHDIFLDKYVKNRKEFNVAETFFTQQGNVYTATVTIVKDNEEEIVRSRGNGGLDSVSNALCKFLGKNFEVMEYEQHALTEGSHAKAISYVSVKDSNGKIFWGAGIHEDIMTSSIEALVSAINNSY